MSESGGITFNIDDLDNLTQAEVYGKTLTQLAYKNKDIVLLTCDLMRSTKIKEFALTFPDRFFNFGLAEQNMFSAAAGFAFAGKIPFCTTMGVFASMRALEQVRTDIAYNNFNVKIVGTHTGLSFGQAGTTHVCLEDIGIMRSISNMIVIAPADSYETSNVIKACLNINTPVYIRIGRGFEPPVYESEDYNYEIGKAITMRQGEDITVFACGVCVAHSLEAAFILEEENNLNISVVNVHTIKPIDRETIINYIKNSKIVITVEDHNIIGGLGSAIAEIIAEEKLSVNFKRLGIPDTFSIIGYPEDLYRYYGIDADGIVETVLSWKCSRGE